MRKLLLLVLCGLWAVPAFAQLDTTYESISVAASAVGLSASTYTPASAPSQMATCLARLETAEIRYRMDGTNPTASEGFLLEVGESLPIIGANEMARIKFIRTGTTSGTLKVQCWTRLRPAQASIELTPAKNDPYGAGFSRSDHPNRISCQVIVSTATTIQAIGGSCVAPGAGLSIYVTDIEFGSSAASGVAADSFPTLKSGTGGTCGAATAVEWQALTAANVTQVANYTVPRKIPANSELCWIMTTAGSKTVQINGFIAP